MSGTIDFISTCFHLHHSQMSPLVNSLSFPRPLRLWTFDFLILRHLFLLSWTLQNHSFELHVLITTAIAFNLTWCSFFFSFISSQMLSNSTFICFVSSLAFFYLWLYPVIPLLPFRRDHMVREILHDFLGISWFSAFFASGLYLLALWVLLKAVSLLFRWCHLFPRTSQLHISISDYLQSFTF